MSNAKKKSEAGSATEYPVPDGHIPVMVTTEQRGVFFGYVDPVTVEGDARTVRLFRVRMCVYWTADVRGVLGLAHTGPSSESKVTPPNASARISAVTGVFTCSPGAVDAWESAPWR